VEGMLSNHFFMNDGLPEIDLNVVDDPTNYNAGHYWALGNQESGRLEQSKGGNLMEPLRLSDIWHKLVEVEEGGLIWLASDVHSDYEARDVVIVFGLSGRGTELTSL
jgi:hypothetical protein